MTSPIDALLLTARPHGEHGIVVRALAETGLMAAYVPGGRSRRMRPVLQPGNRISLAANARAPGQLATGRVELIEPRAALVTSGLGLALLEWVTSLTAVSLPEDAPHPRLFQALDALLAALAAAAAPVTLLATCARYELLLLSELGFGLDLGSCAATGATDDLAYVSPKSAQAVSRGAGLPWATRLLPLPAFLLDDSTPDLPSARAALTLARHFIARDLLPGQRATLLEARDRLAARAAAMDEAGTSG